MLQIGKYAKMQQQKNMQANMKLHLHNGQIRNVPQNVQQWTKRNKDTMDTKDTIYPKYVPQWTKKEKRTQYVPKWTQMDTVLKYP